MSSAWILVRFTCTDRVGSLPCSKSSAAITWAQRKDRILLTVDVPEIDASTMKVDIQEKKLTITAKSPSKEVNVELNLHGAVTAEVRFISWQAFFHAL